MNRCGWAGKDDELYAAYHDDEWGVPVHNDQVLFEFLILEGAQAGLSWRTVLGKREHYRKVFDEFDVEKVAAYDEKKVQQLLSDPGIIRNQLKIRSAIQNANVFLKMQQEFGSFDAYLWSWVDGKQIVNRPATLAGIPAKTDLSDAISKDLKKRGMNFVGSTIIYAFLQAVGVVDDHVQDCWKAK